MIGKSSLMLLGMAAVAGAVLFETSFKVQELDENLSAINRQIVAEHDAIQVLRAEWALLNEPSRLDHLAKEFLPLQPAETKQYAAIATIPDRKIPDIVPVAAIAGPLVPRAKPIPVAAARPAPAAAKHDDAVMVAKADPKPAAPRAAAPAPVREDSMGVLIAKLGSTR